MAVGHCCRSVFHRRQSFTFNFGADVQCGGVAKPVPFKHRHDLERHFVRHGEEFDAETADEYQRRADEFMNGPLRQGALECRKINGDLIRFDPST